MSKIITSEGFQANLEAYLNKSSTQKHNKRFIRLAPILIVFSLIVYISIAQIPILQNLLGFTDLNKNKIEEFKIIKENTNESASYISVVYLDGFAYEPSEWLDYSLGLSKNNDFSSLKGEKLGEVTLDLKGKQYTGKPPDFSSTYDVGTQIYQIKDVKVESAILVDFNGFAIFTRSRKYVPTTDEPLNLIISDVFQMLSDNPTITSVELRNEENGAWMNTSENQQLISLLNNELSALSLLNHGEVDKDHYDTSYRIPINLIFEDGRTLHMQVFPLSNMASTFGGFIPLSEDLVVAIKDLYKQGSSYPSLADLIPYQEEDISYLYFKNQTNGDEVLCENPIWSRSGLYQILAYYRVDETETKETNLVLTSRLGKSEEDSVTVNFYETEDKQILTEIGGSYYKPVRGQLTFESLDSYLYNQTDLGFTK